MHHTIIHTHSQYAHVLSIASVLLHNPIAEDHDIAENCLMYMQLCWFLDDLDLATDKASCLLGTVDERLVGWFLALRAATTDGCANTGRCFGWLLLDVLLACVLPSSRF